MLGDRTASLCEALQQRRDDRFAVEGMSKVHRIKLGVIESLGVTNLCMSVLVR
jgi:hypothetical protein